MCGMHASGRRSRSVPVVSVEDGGRGESRLEERTLTSWDRVPRAISRGQYMH